MSFLNSAGLFNVIPDTLDYRWTLDEQTGPFVDDIGNVQATNNGTIRVTGSQYVNGAARQGDAANSAFIDYGTLGSLGSACGANELTVALTIDHAGSLPDSAVLFGVLQSDGQSFAIGIGESIAQSTQTNGEPLWDIRDTNGNNETKQADVTINDSNRHTIVCRKSSGADVSNYSIEVDGDENTPNTDNTSQGASDSNLNDLNQPVYSHAGNDNGSVIEPSDTIVDDIQIDIGTRWTDQQVVDYDNNYR